MSQDSFQKNPITFYEKENEWIIDIQELHLSSFLKYLQKRLPHYKVEKYYDLMDTAKIYFYTNPDSETEFYIYCESYCIIEYSETIIVDKVNSKLMDRIQKIITSYNKVSPEKHTPQKRKFLYL